MPGEKGILVTVERHLRNTFLAGLLLVVPIAAVYLILRLLFTFFDPLLQPLVKQALGREVSGVGVAMLVILLYVAGLVGQFFVGRQLIKLANRAVDRIPLVRIIYRATQQATEIFAKPGAGRYRKVVLLDFPRKGIKSIGLVTANLVGENNEPLLAVYIPTAPNPTTGFMVIVPPEEVTPTNLTVDEAMKMVISGGILSPDQISTYRATRAEVGDKGASNQ